MTMNTVHTAVREPHASRPKSEACDQCGGSLTGNQRNFCSSKCKARWHRYRVLEAAVYKAVMAAFEKERNK